MESYVLLGGSIILGLSFFSNPTQTINFTIAAITIKGSGYLAKKISETVNKGNSEIINLTSWCLTGIPIIGIIKLSLKNIYEIRDDFQKIQDTFTGIGMYFNKFTEIVDKATFWN